MAPQPPAEASATRPGIEILQTRWGPIYGFANDKGVSEALRLYGEYASSEIALYDRLLGAGEAFIDVGCNIGVIAKALSVARPGRTIIGLEPQPVCFRLAVANTLHDDGVTIYPLAASDRTGIVPIDEIDLSRAANYGGFSIDVKRPWPLKVPCPTVRLDAFLAPRAPRPRLVKIDTEGMEVAVLRGMTGLAHDRLVVSAEADRRDLVPALLAEFHALGCQCYAVYFRPIPTSNPRFDPTAKHCNTRHVHLLGFVGRPPDWFSEISGMWPIGTAAAFDELWGKYFGQETARP